MPENAVASAGTDGVGLGCMKLLVSIMTTEFVTIRRESADSVIGHINLEVKLTVKA